MCANTNLIALPNNCSGLSDTPGSAEAVFAASTGTLGIVGIPSQHGFNLRVSGAYFSPTLIAPGAVAPAGG